MAHVLLLQIKVASVVTGGFMKNILIGTYIIVVLLISAFARASQVIIQEAQYNPERNLIKVEGSYSGVCLKHVRPSLKVDQTEDGFIDYKLQLVANEICPTQVEKYNFEMAVDTRSIGLPEKQNLILNFNHPMQKKMTEPLVVNNNFSYVLDYENLDLISGQVIELEGRTPQYAILTEDNIVFKLKGPFQFSKYVNQVISVKGYELKIQIQPIREASTTPLNEVSTSGSNLKSFNVMTIFTLN